VVLLHQRIPPIYATYFSKIITILKKKKKKQKKKKKKRSANKNGSHFENFRGCLQVFVLWGLAGIQRTLGTRLRPAKTRDHCLISNRKVATIGDPHSNMDSHEVNFDVFKWLYLSQN